MDAERFERLKTRAVQALYILDTLAGDGSIIAHNYIVGTCTIGIHQAAAGAYVLIADNWVQASTAITDAGSGNCDNHTAS